MDAAWIAAGRLVVPDGELATCAVAYAVAGTPTPTGPPEMLIATGAAESLLAKYPVTPPEPSDSTANKSPSEPAEEGIVEFVHAL